MKDLLLRLFGSYEPVTSYMPAVLTDATTQVVTSAEGVTTTITDATSSVRLYEVVASGLAGVDWPWVAGVFLFAIVLIAFFCVVGRLVRG